MRRSKIVAAVAAGLVVTGTAVAAAGTPATAHGTAARVVQLATGDSVSLRQVAGRTAVSVRPLARTGPAAAWTSVTLGGDVYVLPAAARFYAGSVLDPSLFDVTAADPAATGIALDVAFPAGTHPSVPGFTPTSTTATSMHGYLTNAGTRTFGAALLAQWRRDVQTGKAAPASLFGVTRIVRSGATTVHPDFPQVTVVFKAVDAQGAPIPFGFAGLINTDDGRKYVGFLQIVNGEARASVPVGNYSLIAEDDTFDPATFALSSALVTVPDFSVTTNMQRVPINFGAATVTPSISTPRPAGLLQLTLEWLRTVPHGGLSYSIAVGQGGSLRIAPAPAPVHGQVDLETTWQLTGTPTSGSPYRYDASYLDEGAIPADQSRTVSAGQVAQVNSRFYTDGPSRLTAFGRSGFYPFDDFIFTELLPSTAPLVRTDYLVAPAAARWLDAYIAAPTDFDPFNGFVSDEPRYYPAGSTQTIDWLRGPLGPGIPQPANGTTFFFCPGCSTDRSVSVFFAPIVDSTPGHVGSIDAPDPETVVATFRLYRNGKLIQSEDNSAGDVVPVPAGAATYRAEEETYLGVAGFQKSVHAVTDLTFHTTPGSGGALPSGWLCPTRGTCTTLPLLTASVPLPTDLTGVMPLGADSFTFTLAPSAGAPATTVPAAQLSITLDGGATYRPVPVSALGHGRFRATITHSAADAGSSVGLRVSGSDTAGDTIAETVDDAYVVANS